MSSPTHRCVLKKTHEAFTRPHFPMWRIHGELTKSSRMGGRFFVGRREPVDWGVIGRMTSGTTSGRDICPGFHELIETCSPIQSRHANLTYRVCKGSDRQNCYWKSFQPWETALPRSNEKKRTFFSDVAQLALSRLNPFLTSRLWVKPRIPMG